MNLVAKTTYLWWYFQAFCASSTDATINTPPMISAGAIGSPNIVLPPSRLATGMRYKNHPDLWAPSTALPKFQNSMAKTEVPSVNIKVTAQSVGPMICTK